MLIDWFTVGAQMVNFIVLVGLMRRFLYQPLLLAIDAREQRVARDLSDAEAKRHEASRERDEFRSKNEQFEQQRQALLTQAAETANAERERLLGEARQAGNELNDKLRASIRVEAQHLSATIAHRTEQEAYAIARKVLTELASSSLEECLCAVFAGRLRQLDGPANAQLAEAIRTATTPALVRSAFELPEAGRGIVRQAACDAFKLDIPIRFETAPQTVCGIEFAVNGHKVVWSIADYLTTLEKSVIELTGRNIPEL